MNHIESNLRVAFRVDSGTEIGTGHLMRCLTLAIALRESGAQCLFLCRSHPGHLIDLVGELGFSVFELPSISNSHQCEASGADSVALPTHAQWLGTSWSKDARDCAHALAGSSNEGPIDWLVVDHYALDARWERAMHGSCNRLMVIDDLADRFHDCDLLLDQNLGSERSDYLQLIPAGTQMLLGPRYALLRAEFADYRRMSLARRKSPKLERLLVAMGGADRHNHTTEILRILEESPLPREAKVTVVMGERAPWLEDVRSQAAKACYETEVLVGVREMARQMAESDLAIGAGGTTTWERCCLGLPTIQISIAANQQLITEAVARANAVEISEIDNLPSTLRRMIDQKSLVSRLACMSKAGSQLVDGKGVNRVSSVLTERAL